MYPLDSTTFFLVEAIAKSPLYSRRSSPGLRSVFAKTPYPRNNNESTVTHLAQHTGINSEVLTGYF